MYGYVRPERGELRIREYETFRGVYCGLCHTLAQRFGAPMRWAVNYDLTFLAMLLAEGETAETQPRRCPYRPLRCAACPSRLPALDTAADFTVILAYWKLADGARDGSFFPALGQRLLAACVRPAYRKAAGNRPDFAETAETELAALAALEAENCPSLDAPADRFARLLRGTAAGTGDRERVLGELLYHLGRIVYLLDAADDLASDIKSGAYNPLRLRFAPEGGRLSAEDERELRLSLDLSHNSLCAAYALLPRGPYADILDNIIYLGLPAVAQAVFDGSFHSKRMKRSGL